MLAFGALTRYRREVTTVDTGYVAVNSGETTYVNLPAGTILSAQVRWKGWSKTESSGSTTSASGSESSTGGSPSLSAPTGAGTLNWVSGSVSFSSATDSAWNITVTPGGASPSYISGTGTSGGHSATTFSPSSASASFSFSKPVGGANWSYSVTASWVTSTTTYTNNPKITVGGQATQHTGTLNDGVESSYVSANGFTAGSNNAVAHNISSSARAYVQIIVQVLV